jgi:hypothetical protein
VFQQVLPIVECGVCQVKVLAIVGRQLQWSADLRLEKSTRFVLLLFDFPILKVLPPVCYCHLNVTADVADLLYSMGPLL